MASKGEIKLDGVAAAEAAPALPQADQNGAAAHTDAGGNGFSADTNGGAAHAVAGESAPADTNGAAATKADTRTGGTPTGKKAKRSFKNGFGMFGNGKTGFGANTAPATAVMKPAKPAARAPEFVNAAAVKGGIAVAEAPANSTPAQPAPPAADAKAAAAEKAAAAKIAAAAAKIAAASEIAAAAKIAAASEIAAASKKSAKVKNLNDLHSEAYAKIEPLFIGNTLDNPPQVIDQALTAFWSFETALTQEDRPATITIHLKAKNEFIEVNMQTLEEMYQDANAQASATPFTRRGASGIPNGSASDSDGSDTGGDPAAPGVAAFGAATPGPATLGPAKAAPKRGRIARLLGRAPKKSPEQRMVKKLAARNKGRYTKFLKWAEKRQSRAARAIAWTAEKLGSTRLGVLQIFQDLNDAYMDSLPKPADSTQDTASKEKAYEAAKDNACIEFKSMTHFFKGTTGDTLTALVGGVAAFKAAQDPDATANVTGEKKGKGPATSV